MIVSGKTAELVASSLEVIYPDQMRGWLGSSPSRFSTIVAHERREPERRLQWPQPIEKGMLRHSLFTCSAALHPRQNLYLLQVPLAYPDPTHP